MGMHSLLQQFARRAPDVPVKKKGTQEHWWDKQNEAAPDASDQWNRITVIKRRAQWEETMDEKYLLPFINGFEDQLILLHKKWSNQEDESGPFVAELREQYKVSSLPEERRRNELPSVLSYRAPVTLSE